MNGSHNNEVNIFRLRFEASEFWSGDVGLTLITVSLTIFTFLILPLADGGLLGRFVLDVVLATLMVSGALRIGANRVTTTLAIVVLLAALVVLWVSLMHSTPFLQRLSGILAIIAFLLYFRIVLLVMFRQGPVTWSRIQGGVSAYLLLGLAWSRAYQLTEQLHAGSFRFVSPPANVEQLSAKLAYFSFCTLTTALVTFLPFTRLPARWPLPRHWLASSSLRFLSVPWSPWLCNLARNRDENRRGHKIGK